jgi:hypothetical protein
MAGDGAHARLLTLLHVVVLRAIPPRLFTPLADDTTTGLE